MRLLWWREAIQDIYQGKTNKEHPVLQALVTTIKHNDLPLKLFEDLTYAREFDLEDMQPSNIQGLLNYCDFTHTPLFTLCLKIIGEDTDCKETATQYGLVKIIKSTVYFARQNRRFLPQDLCDREGLSKDLLNSASREKLQHIIQQIFLKVKNPKKDSSKFLKATQTLTLLYKKQLEAVDYDALDYRLTLPPFAKALRVWIATIF